MKMDVATSSSGSEDMYNLNFTVTGAYARIAEFITDIEDDSSLGFKIEEFKITTETADNTSVLQATFICKDVKIEGVSTDTNIQQSIENTNTQNNTTNTINSSNTITNNTTK